MREAQPLPNHLVGQDVPFTFIRLPLFLFRRKDGDFIVTL